MVNSYTVITQQSHAFFAISEASCYFMYVFQATMCEIK